MLSAPSGSRRRSQRGRGGVAGLGGEPRNRRSATPSSIKHSPPHSDVEPAGTSTAGRQRACTTRAALRTLEARAQQSRATWTTEHPKKARTRWQSVDDGGARALPDPGSSSPSGEDCQALPLLPHGERLGGEHPRPRGRESRIARSEVLHDPEALSPTARATTKAWRRAPAVLVGGHRNRVASTSSTLSSRVPRRCRSRTRRYTRNMLTAVPSNSTGDREKSHITRATSIPRPPQDVARDARRHAPPPDRRGRSGGT